MEALKACKAFIESGGIQWPLERKTYDKIVSALSEYQSNTRNPKQDGSNNRQNAAVGAADLNNDKPKKANRMYKDENTEDWTNEKEVDYATYRKQYCLLEDAYLIMEDAIDRILEYVVDLGAGRPGRQIISDIEGTCNDALLAANNDPIHRKQSPVPESAEGEIESPEKVLLRFDLNPAAHLYDKIVSAMRFYAGQFTRNQSHLPKVEPISAREIEKVLKRYEDHANKLMEKHSDIGNLEMLDEYGSARYHLEQNMGVAFLKLIEEIRKVMRPKEDLKPENIEKLLHDYSHRSDESPSSPI